MIVRCEHCGGDKESKFHKGTCLDCGAPLINTMILSEHVMTDKEGYAHLSRIPFGKVTVIHRDDCIEESVFSTSLKCIKSCKADELVRAIYAYKESVITA
jgi:hypothetical protein